MQKLQNCLIYIDVNHELPSKEKCAKTHTFICNKLQARFYRSITEYAWYVAKLVTSHEVLSNINQVPKITLQISQGHSYKNNRHPHTSEVRFTRVTSRQKQLLKPLTCQTGTDRIFYSFQTHFKHGGYNNDFHRNQYLITCSSHKISTAMIPQMTHALYMCITKKLHNVTPNILATQSESTTTLQNQDPTRFQ